MKTVAIGLAVLVAVSLGACERDQPMTRAGSALDHAGTSTGNAVGHAASDSGAAVDRAGNWVDRKLSSDPKNPPPAPAPQAVVPHSGGYE